MRIVLKYILYVVIFCSILIVVCGNPETDSKTSYMNSNGSHLKNNIHQELSWKMQIGDTSTYFLPYPIIFTYNQDTVIVYDVDGMCAAKLSNDTLNEIYVILEVLSRNDSMFYVNAGYSNADTPVCVGFVHKRGLCTYVNYSQNGNIALYCHPLEEGVCYSLKYISSPIEVLDVFNGWVRVKLIQNNIVYEGWLSPAEQYKNVY